MFGCGMRQVECHQVCLRPPAANPGHSQGMWPAGPSNPVNPWPGPPRELKKFNTSQPNQLKQLKKLVPGGSRLDANFLNCFN